MEAQAMSEERIKGLFPFVQNVEYVCPGFTIIDYVLKKIMEREPNIELTDAFVWLLQKFLIPCHHYDYIVKYIDGLINLAENKNMYKKITPIVVDAIVLFTQIGYTLDRKYNFFPVMPWVNISEQRKKNFAIIISH